MIKNRPFAHPPIQVPMHSGQPDNLHSSWLNYFEGINQQLNQSLTPTGNIIPAVTTTESQQVAAAASQKIIYNITTNAFQGNINGTWETFTTVFSMSSSEITTFAGTHEDRVQLVYDTDNDELYVVKGATKFKLQKV